MGARVKDGGTRSQFPAANIVNNLSIWPRLSMRSALLGAGGYFQWFYSYELEVGLGGEMSKLHEGLITNSSKKREREKKLD